MPFVIQINTFLARMLYASHFPKQKIYALCRQIKERFISIREEKNRIFGNMPFTIAKRGRKKNIYS